VQYRIDKCKSNNKPKMGPSNQPCKNPVKPRSGSGDRHLCESCNNAWLGIERAKAGNGGGKMPASKPNARKRKAAVLDEDEDFKCAAAMPVSTRPSRACANVEYSELHIKSDGNLKK
jgi:hypothetical protein